MDQAGNGRWSFLLIVGWSVVAISLFSVSARAQAPSSPAPAAASQAASTAAETVYEPGDVYLPGSRVYAFVGKTGLGHEHGVMGQLAASKLQLDAAQDAGQLAFDMKSFAADSDTARKFVGLAGTEPATTQREVTGTMLGHAILDAAHFSTATFVVKSATKLPQPSARGLAQYQLQGDFTLHGAAQPIQVDAEAEEQNGWIHLRGGFTLQQTQFGIRPYTKAFGAVGVANDVKVYGDLWIAKERQVVTAGSALPGR